MNNQQAIKQYNKVDNHSLINEASPHQLIAMLINGALSRLSTAKGSIERQDYSDKGTQIGKSIDIISGLQSSLDMNTGGNVATNLDSLYDYMIRRLGEASAKNDMAIVDEVIGLLREIKAGWDGIPKEFHHMTAEQEVAEVAG